MVRRLLQSPINRTVVEAYRLDRYDNLSRTRRPISTERVVEAYRLDRYDNFDHSTTLRTIHVVEAYRLDRYDNKRNNAPWAYAASPIGGRLKCRSLCLDRYDNN